MAVVLKILISLLPVFVFLLALLFLDSYKLVRLRSILFAILLGGAVAVTCFFINRWLMSGFEVKISVLQKYIAPLIEESLKGAYLIYLIRSNRVGFLVDAALFAFAIGAGFAAIENIYYLYSLPDASLPLWFIRGFGTAILHGGTTTLMAILSKHLIDRRESIKFRLFLPGLIIAILIHSLFNFVLLPPAFSTLAILTVFPLIILLSFERSEKALQKWLNAGFDSDVQILEMIRSGKVLGSKLGLYLQSLKNKIPGEILADMLCYLRIFVELAIKAKGNLIMRESGFRIPLDQEAKEKFAELKFLEKSIGKTGKLILLPFLHTSSRDLWQLYMLEAGVHGKTKK